MFAVLSPVPGFRTQTKRLHNTSVLCWGIIQVLLCFLVILDFIRKHLIVKEPYTPKGFRKHDALFRSWVYSKFISFVHRYPNLHLFLNVILDDTLKSVNFATTIHPPTLEDSFG